MTTYYIDPSSPTNGTGTFASPFNTWASVTWAAGNTYLQKAGTTQTGYRILITVGGTSLADRVIIGSYDPSTGAKTTNGLNRAILNGAGTAQTIRVNQGVNYVWIDNFEVYGTGTTGSSNATCILYGNGDLAPSHNIEISNCYVHDMDYSAASAAPDYDGISGSGDYAVVRDNVIKNIPTDGIWALGAFYRIENNYIKNVSMKDDRGDCIQTHGTAILPNNNGVISNNVLIHSNKNSKQVIICGGIGYANNAVINGNYCVMASYDGVVQTSCIFTESANSTVKGNSCIGGYRGIMFNTKSANSSATSNICIKNTIGIQSRENSVKLISNTILGSLSVGIDAGVFTTAVVKNNLVMNCVTGTLMHGSATEDYNCYYGNGTDRALAGGTANWGINSIFII